MNFPILFCISQAISPSDRNPSLEASMAVNSLGSIPLPTAPPTLPPAAPKELSRTFLALLVLPPEEESEEEEPIMKTTTVKTPKVVTAASAAAVLLRPPRLLVTEENFLLKARTIVIFLYPKVAL